MRARPVTTALALLAGCFLLTLHAPRAVGRAVLHALQLVAEGTLESLRCR
jgi:hypothetical protein